MKRIRSLEAPIARAASITPGSIETMFCSTMRAIAKDAPKVIAKIAAFMPRRVCTTALVSGPKAAIRIMNGIGRTIFTSTFSTVYANRFWKIFPVRVVYSKAPIIRPRRPAITIVTETMYRVSKMAGTSLSGIKVSQFTDRVDAANGRVVTSADISAPPVRGLRSSARQPRHRYSSHRQEVQG